MNNDTTCPICIDMFTNPVKIQCGHTFCNMCWKTHASSHPIVTCPMCRSPDPRPTPDTEVSDIVRCIPRKQPCGCMVSDKDMQDHKNTCVEYWKCATKEWMATAGRINKARAIQVNMSRREVSSMKRKRDALNDTCASLERDLRRLRQKVDNDRLRADRHIRRMTYVN